MSTIELYKDKINSMSNFIEQAKTAVSDYCTDLSALKSKILGINSSVCDSIVSKISSSSQTQEQQIAGLEATQREVNDFIDLTIKRDNSASSAVAKAKDEFYKKYEYLKPECEKSDWEKFCDKLEDVGEWCKEHWKEIVLAIEIIVAVVCLFVPGLQGIGTGILIGALKGAITGGLIGGITSALSGGSFLEGFAQGALDGAIMGGALGGVGGIAGKFITCGSKLGNAIQTTAKVSGTISDGMDGFDMLSMGLGMIDPNNPITELNSKLHQSDLYNGFQMSVSMVSSFTGAASQNMACFIAGTMVLTAAGLVAIENIKAGDMVISTNPDTLETAGKTVFETYVRQVNTLVHLTINGEEIVTTDNHPFYVQGRGFIEAGKLLVGDKLISVNGEDLIIEEFFIEECETPVTVYNFQVEDYHTYFVGENNMWVHNAECTIEFNNKSGLDDKEYKQQLSDQQDGLNKMTVDEYQKNRSAYKENGRATDSAKHQQAAREKAIAERTENNILNKHMTYEEACAEANEWAKGKAALHGPDQIAGGNSADITGLGDSRINSSIGSQWKADSRVGKLDAYVDKLAAGLSAEERKTTFLDVELVLK